VLTVVKSPLHSNYLCFFQPVNFKFAHHQLNRYAMRLLIENYFFAENRTDCIERPIMNHIETYAKFTIHEGKLEEFKTRVKNIINVVREKDPGTLRYDWFINEEKMECVAMDAYINENAMYAHQQNAKDYHRAVLGCSDMAVEFLGLPSAEAREAITKFGPRIFEFHSGLGLNSAALKFSPYDSKTTNDHIEIFTRFTIQPGKLDIFKKTAAELLEVVRENDPGTLRYDWFYDDENLECLAMDTYTNTAGMFAHMKNANKKHGELLQYSSVFTEFLGTLSAEAMEAVGKYDPNILPFYRGIKLNSAGGF
jgi:quinol monooxygenase YgiN